MFDCQGEKADAGGGQSFRHLCRTHFNLCGCSSVRDITVEKRFVANRGAELVLAHLSF